MAREQPNVLFVNIGWAERYDGKHLICGNHKDIKDNNGDPTKLSEGRAFLPDSNGFVQCGAGLGQVIPSSSIDVVFIARNPFRDQYEIVGIYFEPTFSCRPWTNSKGNTLTWADAFTTTESIKELLGNKRPGIKWPPGWHMRRWVRMLGTIHYPALFNQYAKLL